MYMYNWLTFRVKPCSDGWHSSSTLINTGNAYIPNNCTNTELNFNVEVAESDSQNIPWLCYFTNHMGLNIQ